MEKIEQKRHSLAHLLAAATLELYPETLTAIGPAVDNGFYYDFEFKSPISETELKKIEKRMKRILTTWKEFEKIETSEKEAREMFADNPYKLELIDEILEKGEKITLYKAGNFTDLCRGGHIENMKEISPDSFTLNKVAGAYWRGDEKNKMLTRIYGLAFNTKEELEEYKNMMIEAEKRDHRKIGKEMDLFTFSDLVGPGLPLWTPKGTAIRLALQEKLFNISREYGVLPVTIPHLAKRALYETSGHADKFGDELLEVKGHYDDFILKPVNCPHHTQIYASKPKSYRDLPIRLMESTMQYRDEKPGELSGLTRVRSITIDDGHIFCRPDQIKTEAINIANIIEKFYSSIGLFGSHWVSLSVRDPEKLDNYIGENADWEMAEQMLQEVSDDLNLKAKRIEGEAAIYGPKLDYMFKDSLGREWQLATIQIDFAMPKRFELEYTAEDGTKKTPVMIHRAILGSYERFLAILIEHFAGAFPVWLAPVQVAIIPVSEVHQEYANKVLSDINKSEVRVEMFEASDSLGKRIRNAKMQKIPYLVILGDKEKESDILTIEQRDNEEETLNLSIEEFVKLIKS